MVSESEIDLKMWTKARQVKVAFHLPTLSNPARNEKRFTLDTEISSTLSEIDGLFGPNKSNDGYWIRGNGVYRMKDGTDVRDPYIRYFIILDPPWEEKLKLLKTKLEAFRTKSGDKKEEYPEQQSIYLEIQYCVELVLVGQE